MELQSSQFNDFCTVLSIGVNALNWMGLKLLGLCHSQRS